MAMLLQDKTKEYQSSLAKYCRTGEYETIPGVNEKNVKQYRRLIFNIIKGSLESAYPLSFEFLDTKIWDDVVSRFFSDYPCQSPQVWYMPKEFYKYIEKSEKELTDSFPLLLSLLWFEWLEIEMYMMEDIALNHQEEGDINIDKLVLNPELKIIHLDYPVHIKNASEISSEDRGDYFVSLHRNPVTGSIRFTDLSKAYVRLLEILKDKSVSFVHLVRKLGEDLGIQASKETIDVIKLFVTKALENRLIIGFAETK